MIYAKRNDIKTHSFMRFICRMMVVPMLLALAGGALFAAPDVRLKGPLGLSAAPGFIPHGVYWPGEFLFKQDR